MNKPEPTDPMVEAINVLRVRSVPEGAEVRVYAAVRAAVASPSWWLRLPRPKLVVGVGLLCGGGALAGYQFVERPAPAPKSASASHAAVAKSVSAQPHSIERGPGAAKAEERFDTDQPRGSAVSHAEGTPTILEKVGTKGTAPLTSSAPVAIHDKVPPAALLDIELAEQVRAYKAALSNRDASARVTALRAFKEHYPNSPLLHEVDLNLVIALGRAQAPEQQRAAAQQFIVEHPESARAAEMQNLVAREAQR